MYTLSKKTTIAAAIISLLFIQLAHAQSTKTLSTMVGCHFKAPETNQEKFSVQLIDETLNGNGMLKMILEADYELEVVYEKQQIISISLLDYMNNVGASFAAKRDGDKVSLMDAAIFEQNGEKFSPLRTDVEISADGEVASSEKFTFQPFVRDGKLRLLNISAKNSDLKINLFADGIIKLSYPADGKTKKVEISCGASNASPPEA